MSGNKLNRYLLAIMTGATTLLAAHTAQSADFISQIFDSPIISWSLLSHTVETAQPAIFDSELVRFVGKIAVASLAALMGLVLIVRVMLTRAIGSMMDS